MKFLFQFFNFFLQFQMHILGNLELKDSNKLKPSDNNTVVKSYILAPKESLRNWDTHQTMSNAHIGVHQTFAPRTMLKNGTHRHLPERKMLKNMAHIGVHCTLHKMAMLKNGTYLCKLQLHVAMGSIIHFCTDTNTQNRTNFTKFLNTRFITENAKTSTFVLFKIL